MRRIFSVVLCLLLHGCASAGTSGSPDPQRVTLVYGWESGLGAQVDVQWTRLEQSERGHLEHALTSSFRISSAADGDDLRVLSSDVQVSHEGTAPVSLVPLFAGLALDFLVSPRGEFEMIRDVPTVRGRIVELADQILPGAMEERTAALPPAQLDERALNALVHDFWNGLVARWLGGELEMGQVYTGSKRVDHMILPGVQVLIAYTARIVRQVPCARGERERMCVELEMRAVSDPADMRRVLDELVRAGAGGAGPLPPLSDFQIDDTTRLVTEPDGLIPHLYEQTSIVSGFADTDGELQVVRLEQRVRYTFRHPGRR